ncbi:MAG: tetratricopeptide repeat-containing sensor histidine kinase, partial [Lachnospiraceae bacterium]|nr:tetratricopeptide repeat-containing sensor histidine kinase [Lachnospiraceae bacterium]
MRRVALLILLTLSAFTLHGKDYYAEAEEAYYASRYSDAIMIALEGIAQPDIDEEAAVELYSILGSSYSRLGDFDKAADYMIRCYEYDKAHGETKGLTSSLINLASMYVYAGKAELAADYALEAIANEEKVGRPDKLAMAYGKACDVYHATGRDSTALNYANIAVAIAEKDLDDRAQAIRRSQRAYALEALGRYTEAMQDLGFAEEIFRRDSLEQSLCIVCFQLAQEYGRKGKTAMEKKYLLEAAAIARKLGDLPLLQKICSRMASSLKNSDPVQAFLFLEESAALQDSINRRKSTNALELFNIEYETARREQTIALQEINISREKKRKQAWAAITLLLLAGTAVITAFALRIRSSEKRLRQSNTQKDFLFKVISHDIHSPAIAQLRGLQMLRSHGEKMSPDEHAEVLLQLERQAESEVELIDNALRWARTKSGTGKLETVRFVLDDLVREVIDQHATSAKAKDIAIEMVSPGNVVVCTARSNLMLALRNVLSNAVKFSPRGGRIKVSLEPQADGALLSVNDHGIGIPADRLDTIFDPAS